MTRTVYRFRLSAVCLGLVALVLLQEPGRVAADTKLDLTANPVGLMVRALHLWDGSGFFGQVQNQAYGYLWPVGPFFAALRQLGVVPWATQRLWWAVVLLVGFLGVVRVSRLLGVRSPLARVIAGLGYVLGVRMITELGTVSAEAWPMAVAPWVLIPLVAGCGTGSPRRWAALSGLAFWMTGAINAVASAAILPLAALFLVSRRWTRRTRVLLGWWMLAVALASLWWAVPLVLLGRYSPPFLDWIEAAAITTGQNDPTSVLRGASHWVPYLVDTQGAVWPAGWQLVTRPVAVAATAGVTLLGLAGLLRRVPERVFLVLVLCCGLALTGLGHISASGIGGLGAEQIRILLDGALAPLRNVHKFQPLVTFPLMIGLGHLIDRALGWRPSMARLRPLWPPAVAVASAGLVAVAAMPALTGHLIGGRSHLELPGYWRDTADWLNARDQGRALVVPAASFAVFMWGRTQDEPLQPLETQSWAVRDAVPLSSAGNIRLLDEVERHLDAGTGSTGLSRALARSGVRWLVVRNDLDGRATRAALPVLVHQALNNSPGISLAAAFGPILQAFGSGQQIVDGGLMRAYPAVEVYAVDRDPLLAQGRVALRDARSVVRFTGSTEALVDLSDSGLLGDAPAIAPGDPVPPDAQVRDALTDTYRRAEANFGAAQRQYSNTLTNTEPFRSDRPVHDYYPIDPAGHQSEARLIGASAVTASSSGSSPFALRGRSQAAQPWAALDGDPNTAWVSGDFAPGVGQWWQVDLAEATEISAVTVQVLRDVRVGRPPEQIRVVTDSASQELPVRPTAEPQTLRLSGTVRTRSIRLELGAVQAGGAGEGFGLAEVTVPGLQVDRPILTSPSAADGGLVLSARSMDREGCAAADTAVICDPDLAVPGEERSGIDRVVDVAVGGTYRVLTRLRPRPGRALDAYLAAPDNANRITASSQVASDPAVRAQAAADQDVRTTWIASSLDREPTLTIELPDEQRVNGLLLQTAPDAPASRPFEVTVAVNGRSMTLFTESDGHLRLPALRTRRLSLTFGTVNPVKSLDSATGATRLLPVGVTELIILGGPDRRMLAPPATPIPVPCGFGPSVLVDEDRPVRTNVDATVGGVVDGAIARGTSCAGSLTLTAGVHRIRIGATDEWLVERVYLQPVDMARETDRPARPEVVTWSDTARQVEIADGAVPRLLETSENYNGGWQANIRGTRLQPYRVDGWRQAFLVPAGLGGRVQLVYAPDAGYRGGLLLGAIASLLLVVLALVPARRPAPPPSRPAQLRWLAAGLPLATAFLVGGPVGAGAAACAVILHLVVARVRTSHEGCTAVRAVGLLGAGAALAAQAVLPWPGRASAGIGYDLVAVIGPALALGALAVVGWVRPHATSAGSDAPAAAS